MLTLSIKPKKLKLDTICRKLINGSTPKNPQYCNKTKKNKSAQYCEDCWNKIKENRNSL